MNSIYISSNFTNEQNINDIMIKVLTEILTQRSSEKYGYE